MSPMLDKAMRPSNSDDNEYRDDNDAIQDVAKRLPMLDEAIQNGAMRPPIHAGRGLVVLEFTGLKCPNFSSSHLPLYRPKNGGKYFPSKTVENIFHQKRWKIFSGGKCFPQSR